MTTNGSSKPVPVGFKLDRLAALCDGVIAIAITILVLGIEVPSAHQVPETKLVDYLKQSMLPAFGFVISFILIGIYWMGHYTIFHFVSHATREFVVINGVFLLTLSFLPFPTGLQAAYRDDELALALYFAANFLCGSSLLAVWLYALRGRRLVRDDISDDSIRRLTQRLTIVPTISLLAAVFSFFNMTFSRIVFLLIPLVFVSLRAIEIRPRDSGDKAIDRDSGTGDES